MSKPGRPAGRHGRPLLFLAGVALVAVFAAGANPAGLIAALGMLPTVATFVLDRSQDKAAAYAIFGMNVAGVIPFIPELWAQGRWPGSYAGLEDVLAFIAMYGAAACGWGLVAILPPIVDALERTMVARQIQRMRERQREWIEIWGPEVRGDLPAPPSSGC